MFERIRFHGFNRLEERHTGRFTPTARHEFEGVRHFSAADQRGHLLMLLIRATLFRVGDTEHILFAVAVQEMD